MKFLTKENLPLISAELDEAKKIAAKVYNCWNDIPIDQYCNKSFYLSGIFDDEIDFTYETGHCSNCMETSSITIPIRYIEYPEIIETEIKEARRKIKQQKDELKAQFLAQEVKDKEAAERKKYLDLKLKYGD